MQEVGGTQRAYVYDFLTVACFAASQSSCRFHHDIIVTLTGGSILIRQGLHLLTMSQTSFSPTKIEKELHIFGQAGAVLVGGLHMGMESCGSLRNLEIRGHLWVYGERTFDS